MGRCPNCHSLRAAICRTRSTDSSGISALCVSRLDPSFIFRAVVQRCKRSSSPLVDFDHRNSHQPYLHLGLVATCLRRAIELASKWLSGGDVNLDRLFHHDLLCAATQASYESRNSFPKSWGCVVQTMPGFLFGVYRNDTA
jgi:hypothetical protein